MLYKLLTTTILTKKPPINQFLFKPGFLLYFSKPVLKSVEQFIKGSTQKGYKGKVTDIVILSLANCHRTIFGKFLSEGVWNITFAWRAIRKFVVRTIYECSSLAFKRKTGIWTPAAYSYAFMW